MEQQPRHNVNTAQHAPVRPYAPREDVKPISATSRQRMGRAVVITAAASFVIMAGLAAIVVISSVFIVPPQASIALPTPTPKPTAPPAPFNPSANAPLPTDRIILDYGIAFSGNDFNGPASLHPFTFLPNLQQVGAAWAAADPAHPVQLGMDVVVNVADSCLEGVVATCNHFAAPSQIQAYIDFAQQHNLLLFLDLQFGRSSVQDIVTHVLPYLERYPFVELAIDTEFHFYSQPYGVPSADSGYIDGSDLEWVVRTVAQIPMAYHIPRKVVMIHQWFEGAIAHKNLITPNPLVSIVVHSDGFGTYGNKQGDYVQFVKNELIQYGGFKLFYTYNDCGGPCSAADDPLWTPQQVLALTPAPLVISYE